MKKIAEATLAVILLVEIYHIHISYGEVKSFPALSDRNLTDYLCNDKLRDEKDPIVILNGSRNYSITRRGFCHIQQRGLTFTIMSQNGTANITCGSQGQRNSTTGFVFSDVTLMIYKVNFYQCGVELNNLSDDILQLFNESKLFYSNYHAAAILAIESQLNITSVSCMSEHYGFSIMVINPYNSTLSNVHVTNGPNGYCRANGTNSNGCGSGIIIHYLDTKATKRSRVIFIKQCSFNQNINYYGQHCIAHYYYNISQEKCLIVNAAALTVVYSQTKFQANVTIENSNFTNNIGSLAGGVLVFQLNTTNATTKIYQSIFDDNKNLQMCFGSSLVYYFLVNKVTEEIPVYPLLMDNVTFANHFGMKQLFLHHAKEGNGAIYLGFLRTLSYRVNIMLRNLAFHNNTAETIASCLLANVYDHFDYTKIRIVLDSITAFNNSQKIATISGAGTFVFYHIKSIEFKGKSYFYKNYGSVIDAYNSQIYLSGELNFTENVGRSGAAMHLQDSALYIAEGLQATFMNNTAGDLGGAIFGSSYNPIYEIRSNCIIQIDNYKYKSTASFIEKTSITFSDNTALNGGNDMYIQHLYNCTNKDSTPSIPFQIFKHNNTVKVNNNLKFSTTPNQLIIHNQFKVNSRIHYPGETVKLNISTLDSKNNQVYTKIGISLIYTDTKTSYHNIVRSHLVGIDADQVYQIIRENIQSNFTTDVNITITVNKLCVENYEVCKIVVLVSPLNSFLSESLQLDIRNCPYGFHLIQGICDCDDLLNTFYEYENIKQDLSCNITSRTITVPPLMAPWIGIIEENTLGISAHCPIGYCTTVLNNNYVYYLEDGTKSFVLKNNHQIKSICVDGRNGTLCGECKNGLSTVFGSTVCKKCSNWWLLTLVVYAALGPLLIYLLYALRLTLAAGTLNGILFYAQIMNGSQLCRSNSNSFETCFCSIFTSALTLNLGFPVCFYDGMSEFAKAMLNLAFPVYLLVILVIVIIMSCYSEVANRISHSSVQVLVTVIHLSFSKLLQATIDVFVPVLIFTKVKDGKNGKRLVWNYDGEVEYGDHRHVLLATLTGLTSIVIILPYLFILAQGRFIIKRGYCSGKLRPFYEAIHGPFKESKRVWFTLRLLLVIVVSIVYAVLRGTHGRATILVIIPVSLVFTIAHAYAKPYKNKWLNLLDCGIMINYVTVVVTATMLYLEKAKIKTLQLVMFASVFITFLVFLSVIVYHVLWVKGYLQNMGKIFQRKITRIQLRASSSHRLLGDTSDSYYNSCSQYREPVMQY